MNRPSFDSFEEARAFYLESELYSMNLVNEEKFTAYLYLLANGFRSFKDIVKGYIRESEYFEDCCCDPEYTL